MVRLDDVRVDQIRDELGLPDEVIDEGLLIGEILPDHLDRHSFNESARPLLLSLIDNTHASFAELANDLVIEIALDREQPGHAAILRQRNLKSSRELFGGDTP